MNDHKKWTDPLTVSNPLTVDGRMVLLMQAFVCSTGHKVYSNQMGHSCIPSTLAYMFKSHIMHTSIGRQVHITGAIIAYIILDR